jgi:hypothetical protein
MSYGHSFISGKNISSFNLTTAEIFNFCLSTDLLDTLYSVDERHFLVRPYKFVLIGMIFKINRLKTWSI